MDALARPVLAAFENANFVMSLQLGDLKNDDAIRRARDGAGASISWIVGHLLSFRCQALQGCGVERDDPYAEKFSFQAPASDGSDYPDIVRLRQDWIDLHTELTTTLSGLSADQLLAEAPTSTPMEDPSVLGVLSFYAWHEAYHVGGIGMLRAEWGFRRTHELVLESMSGSESQDKDP